MNKKITKVVKPKSKTEKLIESTLLRAKAIKETAEESMRRELLESFSPMMKKSISSHLSEMEDFEMEDEDELQEESVEEVEEMEDFEMNEEEDETDVDMEADVEVDAEVEAGDEFAEEGAEEETLEEDATEGEDAEFLAELERLLSEETDSEYQEEDELNESEEGAEEDELNESEEGAEEDELNESEEGEEEDELNESDNSGELSHSFRGAMKESKDGGVYTGKGGKANPYSGKESDKNDVYTLKAENKRLKEALESVSRDFNETVMDTKRLKEYKKLVTKYKLSEAMKLKVMRSVDGAKNDKELKLVTETIENTIRKNAKKSSKTLSENVARKRNTAGKASSMRPVVGGKKLQESKSSNVIDTDLINQWAHWADIPSKN